MHSCKATAAAAVDDDGNYQYRCSYNHDYNPTHYSSKKLF